MDDVPIMEARGIYRSFHGIYALEDINLKVYPGEIHAICGENGAGKSTLMNILSGSLIPDKGEIYFEGARRIFKSPKDAQVLGISIVHQELNLCPNLSVAENIFIGNTPVKSFEIVDKKKMVRDSLSVLEKFNADIDPNEIVGNLSVSRQQMVEIAKASSMNCKVLILDEPTSALTENEVEVLFKNLDMLRKNNIAILYISHRLNEIFRICQKVTVLRDGKFIRTDKVKDVTQEDVIASMVGRKLNQIYPEKGRSGSNVMLEVDNLSHKKVYDNISFKLYDGEILGIFGLMGAGRTEVARGICGIDPVDSGEVRLFGKKLSLNNVGQAIENGLVYITEDRKTQGLFLNMKIKDNIISSTLKKVSKMGMVKNDLTDELSTKYVEMMNTKYRSLDQLVINLSGGNQQKVLLAKWLSVEPRVLVLDEPTRGIDVGAKFEIHQMLRSLCNSGHGIIVISSELPEILGLCDRILIMCQGRIVGEMNWEEATEEKIMGYASGTKISM